MNILGVSDGADARVAVVQDDRVVATATERAVNDASQAGALPWGAVDEALRVAGLSRADVDLVAVAGRFSPPLFLRQRPRLRRWVNTPFSPFMDAQAAWQGVMRATGLGAYQADVAAEWLYARFKEQGLGSRRLVTVDMHRALAEAVYRQQPRDELVVLGLHPMGDGVALSVHRGQGGQLDRVHAQEGLAALHVMMRRIFALLGLRPDVDAHLAWAIAAHGTPDPVLRSMLRCRLRAQGLNIVRDLPVVRLKPDEEVYTRLASLSRQDAAATVQQHLIDVVCDLVREMVRAHDLPHVGLAGVLVDNPRLIAAVAELDEVDSLSVAPEPGSGSLALGAAVLHGGIAPQHPLLWTGSPVDDDLVASELLRAGLGSKRRASLVDRLCRGEAVARFRGRSGPGHHALGARCVLVRADDAAAIADVRAALRRSPDEEPLCITIPTPNESRVAGASALSGPLACGAAAPRVDATFKRRYGAVVARDDRVRLLRVTGDANPSLHRLIEALLRASGCGAMAAFPFAEGDAHHVSDPTRAIEVWRRSGVAALQLGAHYVERDP